MASVSTLRNGCKYYIERTFNPLVASSNLARPTNKFKRVGTVQSHSFRGALAQLVEQLTLNQRVASSNLAWLTKEIKGLGDFS